jgi:hypothetical protein
MMGHCLQNWLFHAKRTHKKTLTQTGYTMKISIDLRSGYPSFLNYVVQGVDTYCLHPRLFAVQFLLLFFVNYRESGRQLDKLKN